MHKIKFPLREAKFIPLKTASHKPLFLGDDQDIVEHKEIAVPTSRALPENSTFFRQRHGEFPPFQQPPGSRNQREVLGKDPGRHWSIQQNLPKDYNKYIMEPDTFRVIQGQIQNGTVPQTAPNLRNSPSSKYSLSFVSKGPR